VSRALLIKKIGKYINIKSTSSNTAP